jgi:hypothetical protein
MICVLAAGRICELGSHAELMGAGGEYQRLFTLQASGYAGTTGSDCGQEEPPARDGQQLAVGTAGP